MPNKVVTSVSQVHDCPIYRTGDRMTFSLPELLLEDTDAVCAIAIADLLPWTIKLTAGGDTTHELLLCRGCRGGRAQAGFYLESLGDVQRDPDRARKLKSLRVIPLFAPLPDRQLEKISPMINEQNYPTGTELITFGQPGQALSILVEGEVEVIKPTDEGSEKLLGVLGHGECFGEMSLLTGDPCSATIRARGDVRALTISKNDFDNLLARNPVLNRYFTKLLALRLNKMSQAFSEAGGAVTGDLSILGPTEVIQAITVTDRTGRLVIRSQQTFDMVFVQGQIHRIDAPIDGEEMFYEFLTWTKGEFRFEPDDDIDVERNFFKNATSLLLEGMRRLDEA